MNSTVPFNSYTSSKNSAQLSYTKTTVYSSVQELCWSERYTYEEKLQRPKLDQPEKYPTFLLYHYTLCSVSQADFLQR